MNKPKFIISATEVVSFQTLTFLMSDDLFANIEFSENTTLFLSEQFWEKYPGDVGVKCLSQYVAEIPPTESVCILTEKKYCFNVHDFFLKDKNIYCYEETPILLLKPDENYKEFTVSFEGYVIDQPGIIIFSLKKGDDLMKINLN